MALDAERWRPGSPADRVCWLWCGGVVVCSVVWWCAWCLVLAPKAANAILGPQKWKTTRKLDLHGLHVAEAEAIAFDMIRFFRKNKPRNGVEIEIVTGVGNHSNQHKARVRPAIVELLRNEGVHFESERGNGAFLVQL